MTKPKSKQTPPKKSVTVAKKTVAKAVVKTPNSTTASIKKIVSKPPAIKKPIVSSPSTQTVKKISEDEIRENVIKQIAGNSVKTDASINTATNKTLTTNKTISFSEILKMMNQPKRIV